jgi:hypothetical protein
MRHVLCGAAAALLVVLSTIETTLAEDKYANVHTVAIVPEIDHELLVQYVGPTHFIYEANKLPLGSTVSDHAVATMKAALKDRFTVLSDSPPPELFALNLLGLSRHQMDQIAALPTSARADAYVVIYPLECQQAMGSLTLIHKNGAVAGYGTSLCTGIRVAVLDAHSGKTLDYGTSSSPAACNDTLLASNPDGMSSAQTQQLTASAENVIDKTLFIAMNGAGLISDSDAKKLDTEARRVSESLPCQWW